MGHSWHFEIYPAQNTTNWTLSPSYSENKFAQNVHVVLFFSLKSESRMLLHILGCTSLSNSAVYQVVNLWVSRSYTYDDCRGWSSGNSCVIREWWYGSRWSSTCVSKTVSWDILNRHAISHELQVCRFTAAIVASCLTAIHTVCWLAAFKVPSQGDAAPNAVFLSIRTSSTIKVSVH